MIFAVHIVAPNGVMEGKKAVTCWLMTGGCSKLESNGGNPARGSFQKALKAGATYLLLLILQVLEPDRE